MEVLWRHKEAKADATVHFEITLSETALTPLKVDKIAKAICKPDFSCGNAISPPALDCTILLFFFLCNIDFKVELVSCRPKKVSHITNVSDGRTCLESKLWLLLFYQLVLLHCVKFNFKYSL
ncbi:hypothetical protein MKW98_019819 [Papaver atlanticum]|uniref:Uncharacterized protein n=1 Tax=Papaver atlanticum TaxID=357466 RepID=A0AAD4XTM9_9MAGN|nr:hypothetical protein MKW98_019819 [Papaver atlanticum]